MSLQQQQQQQQKRVLLNRSRSSLILGYEALLESNKKDETNEYTHQLVASALSLPATTSRQVPVAPRKIQVPASLKSSLRTSASAPCSPNKTVSFNQQEDICLFRKAQTPLAISQKNIFWANEDEEEESSSSSSSGCSSSDDDDESSSSNTLIYLNWPEKNIINRNSIIKIDKHHIELDQDAIYGKVSVKNLNYHKSVTIRYTWNFWESFDNVQAHFHEGHKNYDVFDFKIPILLHQKHHHLYFAIHYTVGNLDDWDNNHGRNYGLKIESNNSNRQARRVSPRYDFASASRSPVAPVDLTSQTYMDLVNKYCFYYST